MTRSRGHVFFGLGDTQNLPSKMYKITWHEFVHVTIINCHLLLIPLVSQVTVSVQKTYASKVKSSKWKLVKRIQQNPSLPWLLTDIPWFWLVYHNCKIEYSYLLFMKFQKRKTTPTICRKICLSHINSTHLWMVRILKTSTSLFISKKLFQCSSFNNCNYIINSLEHWCNSICLSFHYTKYIFIFCIWLSENKEFSWRKYVLALFKPFFIPRNMIFHC